MPLRGGRRRARAIGGPCGHRWSRGREGALSGRISCVRNVETPSWSGAASVPLAVGRSREGRNTRRERMAGKRMPAAERKREHAVSRPPSSRAGP